ncbi:MAG TPA: DUF192 domain-containing protein [Candidatus Coprosoma intestinipullorum]|uniref:DUF192 domain-containing protein n=1 Tax=Candidatus Coprosoma intestinipullorum TaxID=2840752 RepID=A0A9D0ZPP6_9FIRM|nr:DUF192 domain-containing protein [Candidatus Coprosoma intestinipullorum]
MYTNSKKIKEAKTFFQKLKGLMFKKNFDYILKFKTNGIHTFFMKTKIDVVLTDKNGKILYIYKSLKPNRIILPKKHVTYTYEMPEGFVQNLEDKKNISEL